jgi:4,5:9,10-diseco-3-hydroxy-5,9,17-trioxoandrosta-1(10),2-diene-4-oate hydrolase
VSICTVSIHECPETATPSLENRAGPVVPATWPIEQRETLIGGMRMHTRCAGSGAPLVLVHGLLGAASCWDPAMRLLAGGARVYAPDAIGIGRSERVPGLDAGLAASAHRLAAWMDAEQIAQAYVVGTSHGGAVAMYFAALFPQRVQRLVLHAPANPFCEASRPQIRFACTRPGRRLARSLPVAPSWLHRTALTRMYGDPARVRPGSLQEYVDSLRVPGTTEYLLSVLGSWQQDMAALLPLLPRLRALPVHLLWGEMDRAVSYASALRLKAVLKAPLDVLTGLGHLPFEEAPEIFAVKLKSIFSDLFERPDQPRTIWI